MEQRRLGRTGLSVSVLGYGCGAVGGLMVRGSTADQDAAIGTALDAGVTYFDTAAIYGDGESEKNLGRALRALKADPVVGTKVRVAAGERAAVGAAIAASLEASLERLGRGNVDHRRKGNQRTAGESSGAAGTPSDGCYAREPRMWPAPSDLCEAGIEGIGVLGNRVADEPAAAAARAGA